MRKPTPYQTPTPLRLLLFCSCTASSKLCRSSCTAAQPLAMSLKQVGGIDAMIWMRGTPLSNFCKPLSKYGRIAGLRVNSSPLLSLREILDTACILLCRS